MSVPRSQDLCLSKRRYLLCSYDWLPESGRCSRRPYNIYLNRRRLWWKLPEKVAALFAYLKYVIRIHCHWITVVQTHLRYLCIQMIAWWTVYSWAFIVVLHNITECLCSLCIVFAKPTHCFSYVSSLSVCLNASRNSELKIIVLKPIVKGNQPKPRQYKYRMSPNVLSSTSLSSQFFTLFYPSPSVPLRSPIQCFFNKVAVHGSFRN